MSKPNVSPQTQHHRVGDDRRGYSDALWLNDVAVVHRLTQISEHFTHEMYI